MGSLKYPRSVIIAALVIVAITIYPLIKLGKEFMPLHEGTYFYMPVTVPSIYQQRSQGFFRYRTGSFKKFLRYYRYLESAGRAETATDPAPLEMFETVVNLKPEKEWRKGMTPESIRDELNDADA